MAEKAKKMSVVFDPATGTLAFNFPGSGLEALSYRLSEFPDNVVAFWTGFGMKTAGRNASIGGDEDGSVGTPDTMRARIAAKFEQWRNGVLRLASSGGERSAIALKFVEAYSIAKRMQAALEAGADADDWADYPEVAPMEELRAQLEEKAATVTNPEEVAAARAKAEAAGDDPDEAGEKVEVTQFDVIKSKTLFKLALAEAQKARDAAKRTALKAKLAAEAV